MNEDPNPPAASGTLPWTRSCFVCGQDNPHGLRLKSRVEGGLVVIDYTVRDADRGYRHIMHGGIAMTLLDEVMTWAAILAARRPCVAAEVTVRLRRPIEVGETLRIEGDVQGGKSRLILARGRVRDGNGDVRATAAGKYVPMPPGQVALCEKDFVRSAGAMSPESVFSCGPAHGSAGHAGGETEPLAPPDIAL